MLRRGVIALIVTASAILCASEPRLIVFALAGVCAGVVARFLLHSWRRFSRGQLLLLFIGLACILLGLVIPPLFVLKESRVSPPSPPVFCRAKYSAYVTYDRTIGSWTISDDLLVLDAANVRKQLQENEHTEELGHGRPGGGPPAPQSAPGRLSQILSSCGWQQQGAVGSMLHLIQRRMVKVRARWFPLQTVNEIALPKLWCQDIHLELDSSSRAVLSVPMFMVVRTLPAAASRKESLTGGTERLVLPLDFLPVEKPGLQLEVTSPPARNKFGSLLVEGAIWKPLRWLGLALSAIFSEQIKLGLLIPAVKRLFKLLGIQFKEAGGG